MEKTSPAIAPGANSSRSAFETIWREMEAANPLPPDIKVVPGGMSDEVAAFLDEIGSATPERMAELMPLSAAS